MADTPSQNFGPLPDTLTFGPFGPDGDIIVHIENLVLGCPPYVENIGVPFVCPSGGIQFTVPEGESINAIYVGSDEPGNPGGYFMVSGDPVVHMIGDLDVSLTEGVYCLYPTDEEGVPSGPSLSVYVYSTSLTVVDPLWWSGAKYIVFSLDAIPTLDASSWNQGKVINGAGAIMTYINASGWTSANTIILAGAVLSSVSWPSFSSGFVNLQANDAGFNQATVDAALAGLVANASIVSGSVTLNGTYNAAPSATGYSNKAILQGRGLTVTTN